MIDEENSPDQEEKKHPEQVLSDHGEKESFQFFEFCRKFIDKAANLS